MAGADGMFLLFCWWEPPTMSLEQGTPGEYAVWVLALIGVWALASPFVYPQTVSGAAKNNYVGIGIVVLLLAGFVAFRIRQ